MATAKVDRLARLVATLEAALKANETLPPASRKAVASEKERAICNEIRELVVGNDFGSLQKEDRRYGDYVTKSIDLLFILLSRKEQTLRALAEESLDAMLRSLLSSFNHSRVLVVLISQLAKNGHARSVATALTRLGQLIKYSKSNRVISYGTHIVTALSVAIKRPEEVIQQAIIANVGLIFDTIGPKMRDQHVDKASELYRVSADNLDLSGVSNRAAVATISQICNYYGSILHKAFTRCWINIREPDEVDARARLIGSLNAAKSLWPLAVQFEKKFPTDTLRSFINSTLCCLYSSNGDVVVPAIELCQKILENPLRFMYERMPQEMDAIVERCRLLGSRGPASIATSSLAGSAMGSLTTSPSGSIMDLPDIATSSPLSTDFQTPLEFPEQSSSGDSPSTGTATPVEDESEIIDPLMHSELYEEVNRPCSPSPLPSGALSPHNANSQIPSKLPEISISSSSTINYFVVAAATLARRFLLDGVNGLTADRDVRISHKILAMNCLRSIAASESIADIVIDESGQQQALSSVVGFVHHDDDQLSASATALLFVIDGKGKENVPLYRKNMAAFAPIRKRAVLHSAIGQQEQLERIGLLTECIELACAEVKSTFFLLQVTCGEFLANIRWKTVARELRRRKQRQCLRQFFSLLFHTDPKTSQAVLAYLPRLVRNADFCDITDVFCDQQSVNHIRKSDPLPVVLNLSDAYSFRRSLPNEALQGNLEEILSELMSFACEELHLRANALCCAFEALLVDFPACDFPNAWQCIVRLPSSSCGFLSTVVDLYEMSVPTVQQLASPLRLIGKFFAGISEANIMCVVEEQTSCDRKTLPRLPDPPLLERILLAPLRVLNMYYSLLTERKSALTQSSLSLLSRPSLSPLPTKKASPSRIADISRLLGTSIHPNKLSSYLESPTTKAIFPSLQGAYNNYLQSVDIESTNKFSAVLEAALETLCVVLEMMTFWNVKPLLEEILLYVRVLFEVTPPGCVKLLHQIFKVIFGKNAANLNLDAMQHFVDVDGQMANGRVDSVGTANNSDFDAFVNQLGKRSFVEKEITRDLGWLKLDMLSRIHTPHPQEITPTLELCETFITKLIHLYSAYHSNELRSVILAVMCELPRDGIIYAMADPKQALYEAVLIQFKDLSSTTCPVLSEMMLYFIVLTRTGFLKQQQLIALALDMLEKATAGVVGPVLTAIYPLFLEFTVLQGKLPDDVYEAFKRRGDEFMREAPETCLRIWVLILQCVRLDELSWSSASLDFFGQYCTYLSACERPVVSMHVSLHALFLMCDSTFRPIDSVVKFIEAAVENEKISSEVLFARVSSLSMLLLCRVPEELLLMRLDELISEPIEYFATTIYRLVTESLERNRSALETKLVLFWLRMLLHFRRQDLQPKIVKSVLSKLDGYDALKLWPREPQLCGLLSQLSGTKERDMKALGYLGKAIESGREGYRKHDQLAPSSIKVAMPVKMAADSKIAEFLCDVMDDHRQHTIDVIAKCLAKSDASEFSIYDFTDRVPPESRRMFYSRMLSQLEERLNGYNCDAEQYKSELAKVQEHLDVIEEIVWSSGDFSDYLHVLADIEPLLTKHRLECRSFNDEAIGPLLQFVAQKVATGEELSSECRGVVFLLHHASTVEQFASFPVKYLHEVESLLCAISKSIRKNASFSADISGVLENVQIVGTSNIVQQDTVTKLFNEVHFIMLFYRSTSSTECTELEKVTRALLRHPLLDPIAKMSYNALKMNWTARIIIREDGTLSIPLVNIHLLCTLENVTDFVWRINWLGWTSKKQFEDFWMSLFGVLSSTPTGSEIDASNSHQHTEQILSSSCSVDALTDLLLQSLLYPEPGRPSSGAFVMKHREHSDLFYSSKSMEDLRQLMYRLLRASDSSSLFASNMEVSHYKGEVYRLGMLSATALWTLTGTLKTGSTTKVRLSVSEFLLKTTSELDTASCVRALFENYSHWISRGLEHMPIPLISSTVRSMAILSDLFDELSSYEFLYVEMKNVFNGGQLCDHSDIGYVIYALLKCLAVVGMDQLERGSSDSDAVKQIIAWIETGLTAKSAFAQEATLHGILYLLQSESVDALKPVFQYCTVTLYQPLEQLLSVSDLMHISSSTSSKEYWNLVWATAFRFMEEPQQVSFRNNLNQRICDTFMSPMFSTDQLNVITSGIEGLICHSATYIPVYLPLVLRALKQYTPSTNNFIHILRVFTVCVFRDVADPRRCSFARYEEHIEELFSILRRCDAHDANLMATVLPSILLRLYPEERVLVQLLDLCTNPKRDLGANFRAALVMLFEFFERLRDLQRIPVLTDFAQVVVQRAAPLLSQSNEKCAVAACMLLAASPYQDVTYRFHFFVSLPTVEGEKFEEVYRWALDRLK